MAYPYDDEIPPPPEGFELDAPDYTSGEAATMSPDLEEYPVSVLASTFGYNDPNDPGVGAWGDVTNSPDAYGVALPEEDLRRYFGDPDKARGQLVAITGPNGKTVVAPIVDKGPAPWVTERQGPTIDITEGVRRDIGSSGLDPVEYRIVPPPPGGFTIDTPTPGTQPQGAAAPQPQQAGAGAGGGIPPPPEGATIDGPPIEDAIDPNAPYMSRPRDPSGIHRIIMHGNVGMGFDELIQYGRQVDPGRGFDPGYHFYIAKDGTIKQGAPVDRITNHAYQKNSDSIGIVIDGADDGQMPTPAQEQSAKLLVSQLGIQYGIDPQNVVGHGEIQENRDPREAGNIARDIREQGYWGQGAPVPQEIPPPPEGFTVDVPPSQAAPVPELARTEPATPIHGATPAPTPLEGQRPSYPPFTPENIRQGIPVHGWTPSPTPIQGVPRAPEEQVPVPEPPSPAEAPSILQRIAGGLVFPAVPEAGRALLIEAAPRLIRETGTAGLKILEGSASGLAQFLKPVRNPYVDIEDPKKAIKQAGEDLPDLLEQKRVEKERIQMYTAANLQDSKVALQAFGRLDEITRKIEFAERAAKGDITEAPLSGGQASRALAPLAKPISEVNEAWREKVQPFIDESQNKTWYNQAASSIGSSIPSTASFFIPAVGEAVGLFAIWAQTFAEKKDEYRETIKKQGKTYNEDQADQYAWEAARRSTPWEVFGDLAAATGLKGVVGLKDVFKALPRNIMKADATTAGRWFMETLKEASPALKKVALLPAGMAGEVGVTTPRQSIEDAAVAEKFGLAKPTTAAEKLAKAYSPETLGPAAIQTALMFGLPTATIAASRAAQAEPVTAPPQVAPPAEAPAVEPTAPPSAEAPAEPFKPTPEAPTSPAAAPAAAPTEPTAAAPAPAAPAAKAKPTEPKEIRTQRLKLERAFVFAPEGSATREQARKDLLAFEAKHPPQEVTVIPAPKKEIKTFADLPEGLGKPVGGTVPPAPEAAARIAEPKTEAERAQTEAEAETRRLMEEAPGATEEELDILEQRFAKGFAAKGVTPTAAPTGTAGTIMAPDPEGKPPGIVRRLLSNVIGPSKQEEAAKAYGQEYWRTQKLGNQEAIVELGEHADVLTNSAISQKLGIKTELMTSPDDDHMVAYVKYSPSGNVTFHVNPRVALAIHNSSGADGMALQRLMGEEVTHAGETLMLRNEWQKGGSKGSFVDYMNREATKLFSDMQVAVGISPDSKVLQQTVRDAYNVYYSKDPTQKGGGPMQVKGPKIFTEVFKQGPAQMTEFLGEFVRMAKQQRDQGNLTEANWKKIFNIVKNWFTKTLDRLNKALPGAYEGKFGPEVQQRLQKIDAFLKGEGVELATLAEPTPAAVPGAQQKPAAAKTPTEVARNIVRAGFYSRLESTIAQKMPKSASPEQAKGIINGAGLKPEEIKWSGVMQAIDRIAVENNGKVPKEALQEYLANEGQVRMVEVTLGGGQPHQFGTPEEQAAAYARLNAARDAMDAHKYGTPEYNAATIEWRDAQAAMRDIVPGWGRAEGAWSGDAKFGQYTLPGGENYREVVLTMPREELTHAEFEERQRLRKKEGLTGNEQSRLNELNAKGQAAEATYTSSHFPDVPNYVAHSRLNDRTDAAGKPGLFIEEIQSDRHQKGREKGYKPKETVTELLYKLKEAQEKGEDEEPIRRQLEAAREGIPEAPFAKDWPIAMFKRALRDAVATGKEWIGWTTGETQAKRYDLSKQVDYVNYRRNADGTFNVKAGKSPREGGHLGGQQLFQQDNIPQEKLADTIGKELADKMIAGEGKAWAGEGGPVKFFDGQDLKVGGQGMKGFYDKMLPTEVAKYVKQWGGKVEQDAISSDPEAPAWQQEHLQTPIWRVEITPAMRKGVTEEGQALFARPAPKPKPTPEKAKPKPRPKPETAEEEAARFGARGVVPSPLAPTMGGPFTRLRRTAESFFRPTAELFRRTPGLEFGGNAMLRHQDNLAAWKGELTAVVPTVNSREVNEQVQQYWTEQLGPGPSHGVATLPAHPEAERIVKEQRRLKQEIKDRNQRLGIKNDPGDVSEYPMMLSAETLKAHQTGSGPHWQRLKDDMVNEGIIPRDPDPAVVDKAADQYLKKVENQFDAGKSIAAPGLRLPMSAYEFRPGGFISWGTHAAEKAALRDAFGSVKYTPPGTPPGVAGKNLFDRMRERTKVPKMLRKIDIAEALAYGQSTPNAWSGIINAGTNIATATQLGNVRSTSKNLLSGLAGNITRWPSSFLKMRTAIQNIPETKTRGLLQNDLFDAINDINHPSITGAIAGQALKKHGYPGVEMVLRSMALGGAKNELRAARAAYGNNPKSRRALQFMARAQRLGFANPEALIQEAATGGPLADAFLRRAVNRVHGGYAYTDVPLYASGEHGGLFRQYGKWGLEHFNTFYEDIAKPMLRAVPFVPKETVEVTNPATGAKETVKVPGEVLHLAMYMATMAAAAGLWDFAEELIWDKPSDWEKWTAMFERLSKGELEVGLDALGKLGYAMLNLGTLGFAGGYGKAAIDYARGKTNLEQAAIDVPAVGMVTDAVAEVQDFLGRKDWTPAGFVRLTDRVLNLVSAYRAVKGPIAQALHANDLDIFNSDITAYKIDRANARASMRRMEDALGIERKPPVTGIVPTAKTALKDKLNDLVATGRLAEARGLIKEETAKLKDPKSKEELEKDLAASTEAKHPLGAGKARRELLMAKAKKLMTPDEYERVRRVQKEYEKNAVKMGLMKAEGASPKQKKELEEKLTRNRRQRSFEPGLVEQLMSAAGF